MSSGSGIRISYRYGHGLFSHGADLIQDHRTITSASPSGRMARSSRPSPGYWKSKLLRRVLVGFMRLTLGCTEPLRSWHWYANRDSPKPTAKLNSHPACIRSRPTASLSSPSNSSMSTSGGMPRPWGHLLHQKPNLNKRSSLLCERWPRVLCNSMPRLQPPPNRRLGLHPRTIGKVAYCRWLR